MSTTTASASTAPKPVESANKPARPDTARAQADKPAEPDLFASLLGLLSDTHAPTASPLQADVTLDASSNTATDDKDTNDNPLAALLGWTLPGATGNGKDRGADTTGAAASADSHTTGIDKALNETGVDITGMARVDEAAPSAASLARAAAASRPAFSPLQPGHAPSAAARAVDSSPTAFGATPAMQWQRGAASGSEALQPLQQHQAARSTVALDERFGLAGSGTHHDNAAAPATTLREFGVSSNATASGPSPGTGPAVAGAVAAGETASHGDTRQDAAGDGAQADAEHPAGASADTEGPTTISHWGTQHLRHASLRVGGEGGADTAIDIQLAVKGQEVQVAFQTDNAEARASLRDNAGASLAELMQRSGMQLGGVSVGGQSSGDNAAQGRAPGHGGGRTEGVGRSGSSEAPANRPPMAPPRADGSRPLDVFA